MNRRPAALVAALVTVIALVGCTGPKHQTSPEVSSTPTASDGPADVDPGLAPFYAQPVAWESCGALFECASVEAPLDWSEPGAGSIELAIMRTRASGERLGSLLINPGGPGASGIEMLGNGLSRFGAPLRESYDIVGFDPRGVGQSSAVDCGTAEQIGPVLTSDLSLRTEQDLADARAVAAAFGEGCLEQTGPLLGHVDTVSAAKDMDLLRAVLGDEQLNYLGYSYGTFLGATYAGLFPERVGRMVLDGAIDPTLSSDDLGLEQARGFENALRAYVADCQARGQCPLRGDVDQGVQEVADMLAAARQRPMTGADGKVLNGTLAFYGVVLPLYSSESWPALTEALRAMRNGSPDQLLYLADLYLDRDASGEFRTNSMVAFTAINCLDYPVEVRDLAGYQAFAAEVAKTSPTFTDFFAYAVGCEVWPFESTADRSPITAAGAAPVVVIGTTNDPATPYEWSQRLAEQLDSGVLLTFEGEGHTAYGRSNACIAGAVEQYLVAGQVPADGTVC